jgi:hypothetical protein
MGSLGIRVAFEQLRSRILTQKSTHPLPIAVLKGAEFDDYFVDWSFTPQLSMCCLSATQGEMIDPEVTPGLGHLDLRN